MVDGPYAYNLLEYIGRRTGRQRRVTILDTLFYLVCVDWMTRIYYYIVGFYSMRGAK